MNKLMLGVVLLLTSFAVLYVTWTTIFKSVNYDDITILEGPVLRYDCYKGKKRSSATQCFIWIQEKNSGRTIGIQLVEDEFDKTNFENNVQIGTVLSVGFLNKELNSKEIDEQVTYYDAYQVRANNIDFMSIDMKEKWDSNQALSIGGLVLATFIFGIIYIVKGIKNSSIKS